LWLGTTQTLRLSRPLGAAALWRPVPDNGRAYREVQAALARFRVAEGVHPASGTRVMRVRTYAGAVDARAGGREAPP
nr:hypothetical protein [Lysobacter sp.]